MSNSRFIGKRSPKGLVIRELNGDHRVGQWFVKTNADGEPIAKGIIYLTPR